MDGDRPGRFKVAGRYANNVQRLAAKREAEPLIGDWYGVMTPYMRAIGYGLFALTNDHPDDTQVVATKDLLEVIEVAKPLKDNGSPSYTTNQYRDAFRALEGYFNLGVPMVVKQTYQVGKETHTRTRVTTSRLLESLGCEYEDEKTGERFTPDDPSYKAYRKNINKRVAEKDKVYPKPTGDDGEKEEAAEAKPKGRPRKKDRERKETDLPVWALVRLDKDRKPVLDKNEEPIPIPPVAFTWRWTRIVAEDLTATRGHGGRIYVSQRIFGVMKRLRDHNKRMAQRLLDFLTGDIADLGPPSRILEKDAAKVFKAMGLRADRSARNKKQVADAVRALKKEGVLAEGSDEYPHIDPNEDRRKGAYYRWLRPPEWVPKPIAASDTIDAVLIEYEETEKLMGPEAAVAAIEPPKSDPVQARLFGGEEPRVPTGREIRAARESAGLTMRQFARQFGRSIGFWSAIENETPSKRTGKPKPIPVKLKEAIAAFVDQNSGWKEGLTE